MSFGSGALYAPIGSHEGDVVGRSSNDSSSVRITTADGKTERLDLSNKANWASLTVFYFVVIWSFIASIVSPLLEDNHLIFAPNTDIGIAVLAAASLSAFCWFTGHAVLTICYQKSIPTTLRKGWQILRWAICALLYFMALFMTDYVCFVYIQICSVVSVPFIMCQIGILIIVLSTRMASVSKKSRLCMVIGFLVVAIVEFGLALWQFVYVESNLYNLALITLNFVACVILFISAIVRRSELISMVALVAAYVGFLTFEGLLSKDDENGVFSTIQWPTDWKLILVKVIGSVFTFAFGLYLMEALRRFRNIITGRCRCIVNDGNRKISFIFAWFYVMLAMASMYVTMTMTCWGKSEYDRKWVVDRGTFAKWVNIVLSWVSLVLCGYTVFGPVGWTTSDLS